MSFLSERTMDATKPKINSNRGTLLTLLSLLSLDVLSLSLDARKARHRCRGRHHRFAARLRTVPKMLPRDPKVRRVEDGGENDEND